MSSAGTGHRDFFISFNSANRDWAEWIASELEAAGYTTYFQHWDFAPGSNFVIEMQKAASQSDRTIAVLTRDYLKAPFTQAEWAAALVQDPAGLKRTLVPVRVEECRPDGIFAAIVNFGLGESRRGSGASEAAGGSAGRRTRFAPCASGRIRPPHAPVDSRPA